MEKKKMKVILMLNSECNARCKHCYLEYSGARDPKDALKTVRQLQANGYEVDVAGSETLLKIEYLECYQVAGVRTLLTNGIVLDKNKSVYDILKKYGIEELEMSVHFGVTKDLKSVPETLMARVFLESKKRGFRTAINTVITPVNYCRVEEMCKQALAYGASKIHFIKFVTSGRGKNLEQKNLTQDQVDEFYRQVLSARKKYPPSVIEIRPFGNFGPLSGSSRCKLAVKENKFCPAGRDSVAVDPQNIVYACPFLMQPENAIGKCVEGKIIINKDLLGGRRDTCIAHLLK